MSRLTKKHRFLELYIVKENVPQHIAFDKLGKLEDIEDELGCPLEVVFRAIKEDIIDIEGSRVSVGLEYIQASKEWLLIGKFCRTAYDVKDYKKTWWLKGEKDEK